MATKLNELYEKAAPTLTRGQFALIEALTGEGRPVGFVYSDDDGSEVVLDESGSLPTELFDVKQSKSPKINPIDTVDNAAVYWIFCAVEDEENTEGDGWDGDEEGIAIGFFSDAAPEEDEGQDEVTVECAELLDLASERGEVDLDTLMTDLSDFLVYDDEDEMAWSLGPFTANEIRGIVMSLQVQTPETAEQKELDRAKSTPPVYRRNGKAYFEKPGAVGKDGLDAYDSKTGSYKTEHDPRAIRTGMLRAFY